MVYLIGVKHELQHNGRCSVDNLNKEFVSYLEDAIKVHEIFLVAEEFSEEALKKSGATIGTVRDIANKLNIKHLFCDPNKDERKNVGIPCREEIKSTLNIRDPVIKDSEEDNRIKKEQRKYHSIREKFWLSKIEGYLNETILFVCGTDHVKSFGALFTKKGYKSTVLIESWEK